MSRSAVVVVLTFSVPLVGCGKLAELAGVPSHDVATVTVVVPGTILTGDTVQARAQARDRSGGTPTGDTTATWRSSDPAAVFVDAAGRVHGDSVGRQATIYASVGKVTGSAVVRVGEDQRLGYALADQPAATGPYAPDPAYRFNSSGGTIQVSRGSMGVYSVRFAGLGRTSGQRDNVQVTGSGGSPGDFCKLAGWESPGADLVADVLCFAAAGTPVDSRFTILLSGAHVYLPLARFGFALSPNPPVAVVLDTGATLRNNASGVVNVGHNGPGDYSVQFPGLERVAGKGPETFQVTAVGTGTEHCWIGAVDPTHAGVQVSCATPGGAPADSRFSVMLFQLGRPAPLYRFAYALADKQGATADYVPNNGFWRNNSGGSITARLLATGQYRVVFEGQAGAAGETETVLITPFGADRTCTTSSWENSGSDLTVTLACADSSGTPANSQFYILMVQ
jgi:hypothetical protein